MKRVTLLCLSVLVLATGCGAQTQRAADKPEAVKPPITIQGDGVRIAPFGAPSLLGFIAGFPITTIIEGDVVATTAQVSPDQNIISTLTTVAVRRALGTQEVQISGIEPGGIVPLREVRSHFEGKEGVQPLTEADLSRLVDFRMNGTPHSKVGQHVVMFLHRSKPTEAWTIAAKLVRSAHGLSYAWPEGESPNPRWAPTYTLEQIRTILKG